MHVLYLRLVSYRLKLTPYWETESRPRHSHPHPRDSTSSDWPRSPIRPQRPMPRTRSIGVCTTSCTSSFSFFLWAVKYIGLSFLCKFYFSICNDLGIAKDFFFRGNAASRVLLVNHAYQSNSRFRAVAIFSFLGPPRVFFLSFIFYILMLRCVQVTHAYVNRVSLSHCNQTKNFKQKQTGELRFFSRC